ncbi:MAG TPA: hypothetical protein VNE82_10765 [Candidatus Binataceae bacterium]|nr:hypothetical protein [Candidatus Binataceae bacterium]
MRRPRALRTIDSGGVWLYKYAVMGSTIHAAPVAIALLGLALGMRHATDADHVIAVSAIVTRERRLGIAARIGLCWGVGHTLTIMAVGVAIIIFKVSIPARVGLAMEFAVALVLILLGVSTVSGLLGQAMARLRGRRTPAAPIVVACDHRHPLASATAMAGGGLTGRMARLGARFPMGKAFGVGLVHGLAGSAAIALLVLSAIPTPLWAVMYLTVFGVGTIIGMILITTAIGLPLVMTARRATSFNRTLAVGSGLLSFTFGLFLTYQIGIIDGLFGSGPSWIPH